MPEGTGKQDMIRSLNSPKAATAFPVARMRRAHIIILLALGAFTGCAPLRPLPPAKPISQGQARHLIYQMKMQAEEVFSFLGIGKLLFKEGLQETDMDLLAVGRKPSQIRLELTHTWGKPLLYIVADSANTSVLSFVEHTFYSGPSSGLPREEFFPLELDLETMWLILSGRIPILPHCTVASLRPNELTLFNGQGEAVERLSFSQGLTMPTVVHLPGQGFTVSLSQFKEGTLGPYPSKLTISQGDERQLEIRYTSLQHNRPIPDEIFRLNPPPDFHIIQPDSLEH
jgi:hypothetical protein